MKKPDITKQEAGLQQNDGLKPSRESSLSYDDDGDRLNGNRIGTERSEKEDRALNDAMNAARDNRRDKPSEKLASDFEIDHGEGQTRH